MCIRDRYKGRLITPEEFGEIVIRSSDNGEVLKLKEIADIEMGEESYALSLIHISTVSAMVEAINCMPASFNKFNTFCSVPDLFSMQTDNCCIVINLSLIHILRFYSKGGEMKMSNFTIYKLGSVSYTHLDVYKRQLRSLAPVWGTVCFMNGTIMAPILLKYSRFGKAGWQVTEGCSPSFWL